MKTSPANSLMLAFILLTALTACDNNDIWVDIETSSTPRTLSSASSLASSSNASASSQSSLTSASSSLSVSSSSQISSSSQESSSSSVSSYTTAEAIAALIASHDPANGTTGFSPLTAPIKIYFNDAVNRTTVKAGAFSLVRLADSVSLPFTFSTVDYNPGTGVTQHMVTLQPVTALEINKTYMARIDSSVYTTSGMNIATGYTFVFTTTTAGLVTACVPLSESTVNPTTTVTILFSEAVNISAATASVLPPDGGAATTGTLALSTDLLTVTITLPPSCYIYSLPAPSALRSVLVTLSGCKAVSTGSTIIPYTTSYKLQRGWQQLNTIAETAIAGTAANDQSVQLAIYNKTLYMSCLINDGGVTKVAIYEYTLGSLTYAFTLKTTVAITPSVYALTANKRCPWLLYPNGETLTILPVGFTTTSQVVNHAPTALQLKVGSDDKTVFFLYNCDNATMPELMLYSSTLSGNTLLPPVLLQDKSAAIAWPHSYPSLATSTTVPWPGYVDGGGNTGWFQSDGSGNSANVGYLGTSPLRLLNANGYKVFLGYPSSGSPVRIGDTLSAFASFPAGTQSSDQADAALLADMSPFFVYPTFDVTTTLRCAILPVAELGSGAPTINIARTTDATLPTCTAAWDVIGSGVNLGSRPAIVANGSHVFVAWFDNVSGQVVVRGHVF